MGKSVRLRVDDEWLGYLLGDKLREGRLHVSQHISIHHQLVVCWQKFAEQVFLIGGNSVTNPMLTMDARTNTRCEGIFHGFSEET